LRPGTAKARRSQCLGPKPPPPRRWRPRKAELWRLPQPWIRW
jgi:hypothetical protein